MKGISRIFCMIPIFLLGFLSLVHAQSIGYYGSRWSMDGLTNLRIGPDGQVAVRFRAEHTGSVDKIVGQFLNDTNKVGYAAGTGGQVQMTLRTDDGTSNHFPSGNILASYTETNPSYASKGSIILTFPLNPNVQLTAGTLYHIVYTNTDPSPGSNYVSFDAMYTAKNTSPVQPTVSDIDLMTLWSGPSWQQNLHTTADYNVHFTDGYVQGTGYNETAAVGNPATETFTVSGGNKTALSISARGSGLTFSLTRADGTVLASGPGSVASYPDWMTYTFPQPITLTSGQTYNLTISGSVGHMLQKASRYGMANPFPDGYCSANSGYDLQFYFTLNSVGSAGGQPGSPATPGGFKIISSS